MALPTIYFDANWYLTHNPDVARAIEQGLIGSAEEHFNNFGKYEERAASPLFNTQDYLAANPDVADAIAAGLTTAYDHFVQYGAAEGRSPLSLFDPDFYLTQNPDVAAAVEAGLMSATEHFLLYGQSEPRAINPLINLGAYMNANPDLAGAAAQGVISPMAHLLSYGAAEGRDLGNGVNLGIFANDPAFQSAVAGGNLQAALERAGDVAPFLPTFQSPPGWAPPANTPIPMDFTPPAGTTLVIPPTVVVPPGTELPPSFEPVTPPAPTPPAPTPGGGEGGTTPTFTVTESGDVVSFSGSATGDITVIVEGNVATFTRGAVTATKTVTDLANKTINLSATQNLLLTPTQISELPIKTTGEGNVKVGFSNTDNGTLTGAEGSNVKNLSLSLDGATVTLPAEKATNLLVDAAYASGVKDLKTLNVNASGKSSLDLGNPIDPGIGYFLSAVNITGGTSGDSLALKTLYFGSEDTKFNSQGYNGNVTLDAYIYNGTSSEYKWAIEFGEGDDTLKINKDGSGNYPGSHGSFVDGGGGANTLELHSDVYTNWASPDTSQTTTGTVRNFQTLKTEAVTGRTYQANLLDHTFDVLQLTAGDSSTLAITAEGFKEINAEALASGSDNTIVAGAGNEAIRFGVNTTVTGGEGDDTFVITAPAGTGQPTKQLVITDYGTGNDTIDLTKVANLKLNGGSGDRLEIHQGGQMGGVWGSTPQGTGNDVLVQLSGGSGSQLILKNAYLDGKTVAFKINETQSGLGSSIDTEKDFLVNIKDDTTIDATTYTGGAILSGGGGNQILIGSSGNDIMQGGAGDDIFHFNTSFGIDVILDYGKGDDTIRLASAELKNTLTKAGISRIGELGDTYATVGAQLKSFGYSDETELSVFSDAGGQNTIIMVGSNDYGIEVLTAPYS